MNREEYIFNIGDPISVKKSELGSKSLCAPHQLNAVNALNDYFCLDKSRVNRKGILVMPTGSGKTFTTVYWLLKEAVAKGYTVVWVVHRQELVGQTYREFVEHTALLKDSGKEYFNVIPVSGMDGHLRMSDAFGRDVYVLSRASAGNDNGLRYFEKMLKGKRKVIMVIDEAHHGIASQYQDIWKQVTKYCKYAILLGLTATPTRVNQEEKEELLRFFNVDKNIKNNIGLNGYIYQVNLIDLIKSGFLARPIPVPVDTELKAEEDFKILKTDFIGKNDDLDLTEAAKNKIARNVKRNAKIVNQYISNIEKYGKTIIFAINRKHAEKLCKYIQDALKKEKQDIRVEYVVSGKENNQELISEFKANTDPKFKVLINVQILTEGSDIPDVKTVFITRPISSDSLLMQMIGRALRGERSHGTAIAYIVAFHDIWGPYNYWLEPENLDIFSDEERQEDIEEESYEEELPAIEARAFVEKIKPNEDGDDEFPAQEEDDSLTEWEELYLRYYNELSLASYVPMETAMPIGWYKLTNAFINGKECEKTLLVYKHQKDSYEKVAKDIKSILKAHNTMIGYGYPDRFNQKYFEGCRLADADAANLLRHILIHDRMATYYSFDDVARLDPMKIVAMLKNNKYSNKAKRDEWLATIYNANPVLQQIYKGFANFQKTIYDAMKGQIDPTIVSEQPPKIKYVIEDDYYDLEQCKNEVLETYKGLSDKNLIRIQWSPKIPRKWFGLCQRTKDNKRFQITINRVLSSPFVDREVIKYLIFHELLHENGYWNHDKEFRSREWQFPRSAEWDGFLDSVLYNVYDFSDYEHLVQKRAVIPFPERNTQFGNYQEPKKLSEIKKSEVASSAVDFTKEIEDIKCPNCGSKLPGRAKFCMECGSRIANNSK